MSEPRALPIACSLTAAELPRRLAEISVIGAAALLEADAGARRAVLRFRPGADTRAGLAGIVAAESECCAFMELSLADEPGAIALTIDVPAGAEPVLRDLVAAFGAPRAA